MANPSRGVNNNQINDKNSNEEEQKIDMSYKIKFLMMNLIWNQVVSEIQTNPEEITSCPKAKF